MQADKNETREASTEAGLSPGGNMMKGTGTALVFILLSALAIRHFCGHDLWFHLKGGEYIMQNLAVPRTDMFSYTAAGNRWVDSHWLFQVVVYAVHRTGGMAGLTAMQGAVFILAFALLAGTCRDRLDNPVMLFCLLSAAVITSERFIIRPEMFTLLFLAIFLFVLYEHKNRGKNLLPVLPAVQLVWANMHGLFILGIVLAVFFLAGEIFSGTGPGRAKKRNQLLAVTLACVAVSFINPYGIRGFAYPFLLFTEMGATANVWMKALAELQSPLSYPSDTVTGLYKILALTGIAVMSLSVRKFDLANTAVFAGFLFLSLAARRNTSLFSFAAVPVLYTAISAMQLTDKSGESGKRRDAAAVSPYGAKIGRAAYLLLMILAAAGTAAVAGNAFYLRQRYPTRFGVGVEKSLYPEKAAEFLDRANITGNMFNDSDSGGYLLWKCSPERKVFLDGRWEVYGEEFLLDIKRIFDNARFFNDIAEKYSINYVILTHRSAEAKALLPLLYQSGMWIPLYLDPVASVFIKNYAPENMPIIEKYGLDPETIDSGIMRRQIEELYPPAKTWFSSGPAFPLAHEATGDFYNSAGMKDKALEWYSAALRLYPGFHELLNRSGNIYQDKGMLTKAAELYRECLRLAPRRAEAHVNMGNVYRRNGLYEKARQHYAKARRINPGYAEAYFNTAFTYEENGDTREAMKWYRKTLKKDPGFFKALNNLAGIYWKAGNRRKAIEYYGRAVKANPGYLDAYYNLALIYLDTDLGKAIRNLETIVGIDPAFPGAQYYLGEAHEKKKTLKAIRDK